MTNTGEGMVANALQGVWVPALTPFGRDLAVDAKASAAFCRSLLDQGADGLALFGTTSEANSLSLQERAETLDTLVGSGLPTDRMMPGTGACSIPEAVFLTRHALAHGCAAVLMLPPFYYKGVSDDALFAFFSEVVQRVGSAALKVYLYHIPPVAQVPLSLDLVERLIRAYPDTVVGIKDSSGDWSNTKALLDRFPGFGIFAGSEVFLLDTLRGGGAGCITATGNVNVGGIRRIFENWQGPQADDLQAEATRTRKAIQAFPMIPALKRIVAGATGEAAWATVRPPLAPLTEAQGRGLLQALDEVGFAAGIGAAAT